ncbi:MAG TPA: transaldolase [Bryobacteraceae bacterium]|jgi:transaldolase|nr:transaldolase [Bryobacteraceae bacterium]
MNPLLKLREQGQSVWLDYIRRDLIASGELKRLVQRDGINGVTSNPSIFEKAIDAGSQYDQAVQQALARNSAIQPKAIYDAIAIEDVRNAADVLMPLYVTSGGADGFVSIEPPPQIARDTPATIEEARRIHRTIDRPNVLIKVAATPEGLAAVEALIAEGINVNITLMFSLRHYEAVARAYIRGLTRCAAPEKVASVASCFVSRIDTAVDKALDAKGSPEAHALRGKIAIANARVIYARFREIFDGDEFAALRQRGARVQRPLWASTGTKDPAYSDVLYVEELIGPDTVNTIPPDTLAAFRDHGQVRGETIDGAAEAKQHLEALKKLGIDLDAITDKLQVDGVASFASAYDRVLEAIAKKLRAISPVMA